MKSRMNLIIYAALSLSLAACSPTPKWSLKLAHTADGEVKSGSTSALVDAVRNGCQIRVAWGARRAFDPNMTIEHVATPVWVSVRNGDAVEVQLEGFMANLAVLGEASEDHPRRERFGGTEHAVSWRANLKTDGSFDAVWYYEHNGEFIERVPQTHPMKWFADCAPTASKPLYPEPAETET